MKWSNTYLFLFWGWFLYKDLLCHFLPYIPLFLFFLFLFFSLFFFVFIFLFTIFSFLICLELFFVQFQYIFIGLNNLLLFWGLRVFAFLSWSFSVPLGKFSCREKLYKSDAKICSYILVACSSLPFYHSIPFPSTLGQSPPSPITVSRI